MSTSFTIEVVGPAREGDPWVATIKSAENDPTPPAFMARGSGRVVGDALRAFLFERMGPGAK